MYNAVPMSINDFNEYYSKIPEDKIEESLLNEIPIYTPKGYVAYPGTFGFGDIPNSIAYTDNDLKVYVLDMTTVDTVYSEDMQEHLSQAWIEGCSE